MNDSSDVDLDIANYELKDILNLFKISSINFDESDLKRAKKIVLKMHPDKSKLDSRYFMFYSKAYKMLFSVWDFTKRGLDKKDNVNTNYKSIIESDTEKKTLLDEFTKSADFNKWFNEQFEKNKINDGHKGYGNWLKSDDDIDDNNENIQNAYSMKDAFDKKKAVAREKALIVKKEVAELFSPASACDLLEDDNCNAFNSSMFSNLQYQDLYQAHTETVIPITDDDYNAVPKFANIDEYKTHRSKQNTVPLSNNESLQIINNKTREDDSKSARRAYQLAQQCELDEQKNKDFWNNILLLKNHK